MMLRKFNSLWSAVMGIKTVSVTFVAAGQYGLNNNKQYEYLTELDVKKGDIAVVDSPQDGLVTVKILSVNEGQVGKATKYLVQLVDDTDYRLANERRALRADLRKKLEAKKRVVEEQAVWKWLAENDTEAAALLQQLEALDRR